MKQQIQILLLALLTVSLSAQTTSKMYVVEGSTEFLEGELISKDIRDSNGDVCAAIVISTDISGLSFQSYNGIVKINSNPGRHYIFVSPTERVIEIFKSGYKPLKIILNDYGVKLKSGQTWKLEITGDKKTSDLIPINIIAEPTGAEIFIDGENKGSGTTFQVSKGNHTIEIIKQGYKTVETEVNVTLDNILFNYPLVTLDPVPVKFSSKPAGATLFINSKEKGKTPTANFLFPGEYNVRLSLSGFLSVNEKINITKDGKNEFTYALAKNSGALSLSVSPLDAKVLINKEDFSGKSRIELAPGRYKIEVKKKGYYEISETIDIELGINITKNFALKQMVGKLQFTPTPFDAEVKLIREGKTIDSWEGLKYKELPVGSYQLECTLNGYKTISEFITIEENKTTIEEVSLQKIINGIFSLEVLPSNAEVDIDGKKYIRGQRIELKHGEYKIKVSKDGYETYESTFEIEEDETTEVEVELDLIEKKNSDGGPGLADFVLFGGYSAPGSISISVYTLYNTDSHTASSGGGYLELDYNLLEILNRTDNRFHAFYLSGFITSYSSSPDTKFYYGNMDNSNGYRYNASEKTINYQLGIKYKFRNIRAAAGFSFFLRYGFYYSTINVETISSNVIPSEHSINYSSISTGASLDAGIPSNSHLLFSFGFGFNYFFLRQKTISFSDSEEYKLFKNGSWNLWLFVGIGYSFSIW